VSQVRLARWHGVLRRPVADFRARVAEHCAPNPSPEPTPVVSTANHPPGFDAAAVSTATAAQLKFWIDKANAAAGRKVLTKVGRVDDLRHKLAAHYGLDLSTPVVSNVPAAIGPASTLDIQNRQWDYLCDLGNEWDECATTGRPFLLCQPSSGECEHPACCMMLPTLMKPLSVVDP
jgi:hypothetical protein